MAILLWLSLRPIANDFLKPYWVDDWKSIIYSDKSGYYSYLPFTFIYHWDGYQIPDGTIEKVGNGFSIEQSGVIKNKYPIGTAYFESPFFLSAFLSKNKAQKITGFEKEFHQSVAISTLFWVVLGLIFLAEAIRKICQNFWVGWFISLLVLFSTNLFYYAVKAPGFSHPYSFFLFCTLVFIVPWNIKKISTLRWIIIGLVVGLIFTVRTVNIVFAVLYIGSILLNRENRWQMIFHEKVGIVIGLFISILPIIPQMLYWKYAYGNYFTNSYKGEGFTGLLHPQFSATLISVNNGLLLYTPIWLLLITSLFFVLDKKRRLISATLIFILLLETYLCSSWSSPFFGCSFGHRVFVDLIPFGALSLGLLFQKLLFDISSKKLKISALAAVFLISVLCISYTQHLTLNFDVCWPHGVYDYEKFNQTMIDK